MGNLGKFPALGLLLILLAIQLQTSESSANKDIAIAVIDYAVEFAPKPVQSLLKCILKSAAYGIDDKLSPPKDNTDQLLRALDERVDGLRQKMEEDGKNIRTELGDLVSEVQRTKFDSMINVMTTFNDYYSETFVHCILSGTCTDTVKRTFIDYWLDPHKPFRTTMFNFVNEYVAQPNPYALQDRVFDAIIRISKRGPTGKRVLWAQQESTQTTVYKFYKYITWTLSRMYRVTLWAMTQRYTDGEGNEKFKGGFGEIQNLLTKFKTDLNKISNAAITATGTASRDIYRSDPRTYVEGTNYDRLVRFIFAFIQPENHFIVNIPGVYSDFLRYNLGMQVFDGINNADTRNCTQKYFKAIYKIWVDKTDRNRLYHHFDADDYNKKYTMYGPQKNNDLFLFDFETARNLGSIPINSDSSLCYLDFTSRDWLTARNFSTALVRAHPQYVITGIRWKVYDRAVTLQIQEGKLVNGAIKTDTVRWLEVQDHDDDQYVSLDFDHRSIALDDVMVPNDYFLRGVQFYQEEITAMLSIKAFGSKIDGNGNMVDGYIKSFQRPWDSFSRAFQEEIHLEDADIPTKAPHQSEHEIMSTPGKNFIKFQPSDLKKDAGQSTVPYFDTQEVVSYPPIPLSGFGIYYKGMKGYGGFLGLKLISPAVRPLLEMEKSENPFSEIEGKMAALKRKSIG